MSLGPKWQAMGREAAIAAQQLARGVTALGKANHAQKGLYGETFFSLSIGLERLAKLITISEFAINNTGQFPGNGYLKKFQHNLPDLIEECNSISAVRRSGKKFTERPSSDIHKGILLTLTEFAELSRYYNLDLIAGGPAKKLPEPISAWWDRVGQPILAEHYSDRQRDSDANQAAFTEMLMQNNVHVLHNDESGNLIESLETLMIRAGATRVVKKYGRLYTMQIIHWLSFLIAHLSHIGAYEKRIEALLRLDEYFIIFHNSDKYFRGRKTWSI